MKMNRKDSFKMMQVHTSLPSGILLQNKIYSMMGKHGYFL